MFSRCEYCQHQQRVTVQQLRRYRALLKCKQCGKPFDALASLSEKPDSRVAVSANDYALPWLVEKQPVNPRVWRVGSLALLLLLLVQTVYFEGSRLLSVRQIHALASEACLHLQCTLPAYRNLQLADWSVSHSDLQPYLQGHFRLTAAISNQSDEVQELPDLQLTLLDFNAQPLAERVLQPWQYIGPKQLAGEETREIQLWLAAPSAAVGGFNVSVL